MKRDFDQQRLALQKKYDRQSMLLKDTREGSAHARKKPDSNGENASWVFL